MRKIFSVLIMVWILLPGYYLPGQEAVYQENWNIDNLKRIGTHRAMIIGNPEVVDTDLGKAVRFDGDGDMLLIEANPIGEAKEFTVEVIFKPEGLYPTNKDPRFVHIQDPEDSLNKRVMIELRTTPGNQCYLDGFLLTDNDKLALIDSSLIHSSQIWHHAALTYKEGILKTYMDGIEELSGSVAFKDHILGKEGQTCLGARMDQRNWFTGLIRTLKVTHKALDPSEFLEIYTDDDRINNN